MQSRFLTSMSYSIVLTGNSSELVTHFNPPIYLEEDSEYAVALINFETFNAIPNIDETNNQFIYGIDEKIEIPTGNYEIDDLDLFLSEKLIKDQIGFRLKANNNTLKTNIKTTTTIYFGDGTIGQILGFKDGILNGATHAEYESDFPASILKVNVVNIDCSIAEGSYLNGEPVHIIHQFFPNVGPGFKIIEAPRNLIYFPVAVKVLNQIVIKILDQDGKPVNFRGETVTLRLHVKKLSDGSAIS